jgi:hypothetical protein
MGIKSAEFYADLESVVTVAKILIHKKNFQQKVTEK